MGMGYKWMDKTGQYRTGMEYKWMDKTGQYRMGMDLNE